MATVRDIAILASVSTATVSRVMNAPQKVAPDTVSQVNAAIKALNYKKKVLLKKRSNTFAIIVPNISNPFFSELLEVIEKEAYHHGRCVLFFNSRHSLRQEKIYFSECESHQVDGVFLIPVNSEDKHLLQIKAYPFPTVVLTQSIDRLPSVAVDHAEGGRLVAEHLISNGHSQIAFIGFGSEKDEKLVGFKNYLKMHRAPLQPQHTLIYANEVELLAFIKSLIAADGKPLVSAISCMNDVTAVLVIEMLSSLNIKIPTEITVIGFDNSIMSKILNISSISQPIREIAHLGFKTMLECLQETKKHEIYPPKVLLPRLILRDALSKTRNYQ